MKAADTGKDPQIQKEPSTKPSIQRSAASKSRSKILLIDDEEGIGVAVKRLLRKQHDVTVTTSGEAGLRALEDDGDFEVVICDLMMPGMTGMELYRTVEVRWPSLSSRFLFISGGTYSPAAKEFVDSASCTVLKKPMPPTELRASVETIVKDVRARKVTLVRSS